MNDLHRNTAFLWVLFIGFCIAVLSALGWRTLVPPDEGRYAEIAREMFESGDWVTMRLNHIKYFEKPPLQSWMNALTFALFGVGEWQARLWTGLCGILGVVTAWYAGSRVFGPRTGFYAALVLASSLYWVACSQVNSLDMGLAAMMTLALCALLVAQRDGASAAERRNWMLVCWAAMALAVLAKGLVGIVLPGAVLVIYTIVSRDWTIWKRLHFGKGLLVFFAIAAPWFVLVGLRNPEQPYFFFVHEHFTRFLTTAHKREGDWWIFFALLAAGALPWTGVLAQSLAKGAARAGDRPGAFRPRLMLVVWVVFITLFFSASSSRLPGYLAPVFPAVALLVAYYVEHGPPRAVTPAAGLSCLVGAALLAAAPFASRFATRPGEEGIYLAYQPWLLAAGLAALAGGLAAMLFARRTGRHPALLALALSGFATTQLLLAGFEPIGRVRAGVDLLPAIRAELAPDTKIYSVYTYEQSLTFYIGRPVRLVAYHDEFTFGLRRQPQLGIPTFDQFLAQWHADAAAGRRALAITHAKTVEYLKYRGAPVRVVAADSRRTIIAND